WWLATPAGCCPARGGSCAGSPVWSTTLTASPFTPCDVQPPFLPVNCWTQGGAYTVGIFTRPVVVSQLGPKSTSVLPWSFALRVVIGPDRTSALFFCASASSLAGDADAATASKPATTATERTTARNEDERRTALDRRTVCLRICASPSGIGQSGRGSVSNALCAPERATVVSVVPRYEAITAGWRTTSAGSPSAMISPRSRAIIRSAIEASS